MTPLAPRLMKGAIVAIDLLVPIPTVIVFQYNPDTLTRTLQTQPAGGQGDTRAEVTRLKGPPVETIKLDVELDATDQLERADAIATTVGIHPQLAALEILTYPRSPLVIANTVLLAAGTIEVLAPQGPFTLFVWGPQRVLPVRVEDFTVTEEAHDPALNPIRAKVALGLRVLSYADVPPTHPAWGVFLAHQMIKETMGLLGSVRNATGGI